MAAPVLLNHRRTVSGVLPADGPDPAFLQPTTDYGDTHIAGGAEQPGLTNSHGGGAGARGGFARPVPATSGGCIPSSPPTPAA